MNDRLTLGHGRGVLGRSDRRALLQGLEDLPPMRLAPPPPCQPPAVFGAPTSSVPAPWADKLVGPGRTVVEERAKVVAYLHGLADARIRLADGAPESPGYQNAAMNEASNVRQIAEAIANGEHWQS